MLSITVYSNLHSFGFQIAFVKVEWDFVLWNIIFWFAIFHQFFSLLFITEASSDFLNHSRFIQIACVVGETIFRENAFA